MMTATMMKIAPGNIKHHVRDRQRDGSHQELHRALTGLIQNLTHCNRLGREGAVHLSSPEDSGENCEWNVFMTKQTQMHRDDN